MKVGASLILPTVMVKLWVALLMPSVTCRVTLCGPTSALVGVPLRSALPLPLSGVLSAGPVLSLGAPVQAKLTVGQANDPFEREADTVADRVTAGQPAPPISPIPPGGLAGMAQPQVEEEKEPEELTEAGQKFPLIQRQLEGEEPGAGDVGEGSPQPLLIQRKAEEIDSQEQAQEFSARTGDISQAIRQKRFESG